MSMCRAASVWMALPAFLIAGALPPAHGQPVRSARIAPGGAPLTIKTLASGLALNWPMPVEIEPFLLPLALPVALLLPLLSKTIYRLLACEMKWRASAHFMPFFVAFIWITR